MGGWRGLLAILVVIGIGVAVYFLRPVVGPERNLDLVADAERGTYLLRIGGCVACHTDTKNEGAFLAGGTALTTPFGSFVPPNITSDDEAGIGAWTLAQFSDAMSNGQGANYLHQYYPSFPYDNFTLMSDQDIVDLFAGLQATDAVAEKAPDNEVMFPFNIRLAMLGWKNLFFTPARYEPDPDRSDLYNRGKYLAEGPAHCGACHTPRNIFGARDESQHFMGSPSGTPAGRVPAIDTESLVAAGYDRAWLVEVFKGGVTPAFDVPGGAMFEVVSESTSHWNDEDLEALAAYLLDED